MLTNAGQTATERFILELNFDVYCLRIFRARDEDAAVDAVTTVLSCGLQMTGPQSPRAPVLPRIHHLSIMRGGIYPDGLSGPLARGVNSSWKQHSCWEAIC